MAVASTDAVCCKKVALNRGPTSSYGDLAKPVVAVSIKREGELSNWKANNGDVIFGRPPSLDSNFVGSMRQKSRSKVRIRQRIIAAVSMADYLCGLCGVERSRKNPDYKASSLRTWYGRRAIH